MNLTGKRVFADINRIPNNITLTYSWTLYLNVTTKLPILSSFYRACTRESFVIQFENKKL